ncbi:MAG: bacillithiol biosynthesis BshC, partial [Acidobacteria bacterium]|nr:bacillithiol biosynthesis BshC [Acidobacteriota bacterium]
MTANVSSSSATAPAEAPVAGLDLLATERLPPIPSALLRGEATELLAPLRWLPGIAEAGELCRPPAHRPDRRELAAELADAQRAYSHPAAEEMAGKLADPETLVVVTGQQPGLFGGRLYALSKAVAAARWAAELEAAGRPAVAVFW